MWSIIFLLDMILGVVGAVYFGLLQPERFNSSHQAKLGVILLIVAIVCVFWLQGVVWFTIIKIFQKRNRSDESDLLTRS